MSRHPRRAIAQETVTILVAPSGRTVDITGRLARAVAATRLYRPAEPAALAEWPETGTATRIEVTGETRRGGWSRPAPTRSAA